jgi:hypothetical protein
MEVRLLKWRCQEVAKMSHEVLISWSKKNWKYAENMEGDMERMRRWRTEAAS